GQPAEPVLKRFRADDRELVAQRGAGAEQSSARPAADRGTPVVGRGHRADEDQYVGDDQADGRVPGHPAAGGAEGRPDLPLAPATEGDGVRALVTDRRRHHTGRTDRSVTASAPDVGLAVVVPVADRRTDRRDLSHARKGSAYP